MAKRSTLTTGARRWKILELFFQRPELTTSEILGALDPWDVPATTLGNDLSLLVSQSVILKKGHGTYIRPTVETEKFFGMPYSERLGLYAEEKRAIGKFIAEQIPKDGVIAIDGGTSNTQVFKEIVSLPHLTLEVITNNIHCLLLSLKAEQIRVHLIGGSCDPGYAVVVGNPPRPDEETVQGLDVAIIGVSGVSKDGGLSTVDAPQWALKQWMGRTCLRLFVPVSNTKIGKIRGSVFFKLETARDFLVVTDSNKDRLEAPDLRDFQEVAEHLGERLVLVGPDGKRVDGLFSWGNQGSPL